MIILRREGFQGQRLIRIPRPVLDASSSHPLLGGIRVTDAGFFPRASGHLIERPDGMGTTLVILCTDGRGWVHFQGHERMEAQPGDLIWLPAHQSYSYGADADTPWTISWAHFEGTEVSAWREHLDLPPSGGVRRLPESATTQVFRLIDEASCVIEIGYTTTEQVAAANLLRAALSRAAHPPALSSSPEAEHRVSATIEWMAEHLAISPPLSELAALASVSIPHYSAIFRRLTGYSPVNYHTRLRLQRACFLLDTTSEPIARIAELMGFEDAFYFSRVFRKIIGRSPRQYRALKKG